MSSHSRGTTICRCDHLQPILEAAIRVAHEQAKELERFVHRVEQVTGRLGYSPEFGIAAAELGELLVRLRAVPTAGQ